MRIFLLLVISFTPFMAVAHGGHDHSHWTSNLVHAILFIGTGALAYLFAKLILAKIRSEKE